MLTNTKFEIIWTFQINSKTMNDQNTDKDFYLNANFNFKTKLAEKVNNFEETLFKNDQENISKWKTILISTLKLYKEIKL